MKYHANGPRLNERQHTATRRSLMLLLLLTAIIVIAVTTTPTQTTQGTPQQETNHPNIAREGAPLPDPWAETLGGSGAEGLFSVQQTSDGGYIVAGATDSFGAGGDDAWVVKLDSTGGITWQKTYGGSDDDYAYCVQQTSDGGYIVAGMTYSFDVAYGDVWVLKLTSTGAVTWQKTYGTGSWDQVNYIQQTSDGGYIFCGFNYPSGESYADYWVVKLTSTGAVTWQRMYGEYQDDEAYSIQQTSDGGYIVVGHSQSMRGGLWIGAWILKLNSAGQVTWQYDYEGSSGYNFWARSVQQTSDGGYIVAGCTSSYGSDGDNLWVAKFTSAGAVTWAKTYQAPGNELAMSVRQTSDGGYIVAGYTGSFGAGSYDFWVLKLDSSGGATWQNTYGGSGRELAYSVRQTGDGGYIVAGETGSSFGAGGYDAWLVKLGADGYILWDATCGASTHATSVVPWNSGTTTYAPLYGTVDTAVTVKDTSVTPYDTSATVKIQSPPPAPTIDQPGNVAYTFGETGYSITWTPSSQMPSKYSVTRDGTIVASGSWSGTPITQSVDGLSVGTHVYVCTVNDTMSRSASSSVQVFVVLEPAPTIDQPGDVTYTVGETGYSITWTPSSQIPSKYSVTRDGTIVASGSWSGTPITQNVDGLGAGTYVYTCTVNDTVGRTASSSVQVLVIPPSPTIDQPSDITYTVGETGNYVVWNPSSQIPHMYSVTRDGTIVDSGNWYGWDIYQYVDGLSVGTYVYTCTVNDTLGRSASSSVQVTVVPPAPTIDQPGDVTYTVGETGNSITWTPSSQIPSKYSVTRDGTIVASGSWDGASINQVVDGLGVGTYVYTCTVNDTLGRSASSSVQVTVVPPAPTIDQPGDVTYTVGETGNSITWNPSSQIPDYYTISVDGGSPTFYSWDGQAITYDVDGWSEGTYSVTCTVYDTSARSASSTVTVTVQTPSAGTEQGIPVNIIVGAVAVAAIVVVILTVTIMKRKK